MSNKKTKKTKCFLLLTLVFITILGVSAVTAADNDNITADTTPIVDDATTQSVDDSVDNSIQTDVSTKNTQINKKTNENVKGDGETTHIVTNDTYKTFFTSAGLTSQVSDNDVLDLRGEISIDQDILIDKPVNITSTTKDGKISGWLNVFEINHKGSHSNLTNILLNNTQLILNNADYINVDHITVTTENCHILGKGKGVTSIREGCDYVNVTNSYFYVYDNGGSSNFVLAGAGFVNVENNTIHSEGEVGNIVYLNAYNVDNNATNQYINITNNNITGPSDPAAICWLVALVNGQDVLIKGNNLTYTGDGVVAGIPNVRIEDNNFNNVTIIRGVFPGIEIINNTGIHALDVTGGKVFTGNEINGEYFRLYCEKDSIISNNNIKINSDAYYDNRIDCEKFIFENNTFDSSGSLTISNSHGSIIQNNTITTTADYSLNLTNCSANTVRNNTLIASELNGDSSVIAPGDYIENNSPTPGEEDIAYMTASNMDELFDILMNAEFMSEKEIYIYLEDFDFNGDPAFTVAPDKKITIDGSHLNNQYFDVDTNFINVGEGSLTLKNLKMDVLKVQGGFLNVENGNITLENCFIRFKNPDLFTPFYKPTDPFINNKGNGYVSIKSCTIDIDFDWYTTLTTGNEVYIVDSIILGSNVKPYDANNKPDTLHVRYNYIDSYDKTVYSYVKDDVVAMVNGVVDTRNTIQVTGNEKVDLKLVSDNGNGYDNITRQLGYDNLNLFLGSTNVDVINTTELIFNKSNNYAITLDENNVDETVTLYPYIFYKSNHYGEIENNEKKLMDMVEYIPTEKTSININLSTLKPAADNNIIINLTDMDGNLIQTSGLINVSINGEESITYYFMNGKLTIPYKIMSPDDLTIFAVYGGNDQYRKSNTTVIFSPDLIPTEISTSILNNTYGNVTVEVSVKAGDNFVEDGIITVDGIDYNIAGETTIVPVSVDINGANVTVNYPGSLFNSKNSTVVEIIPDIPTDITISTQTETKVNSTIPVTIILIADDKLLTGQEVTVSTGNGDETIELTKGYIIYQYTPTTLGEETITVTFNSKDHYLASSTNTTITVTEDKDAIIEDLNNTVQEQNKTIEELNNTVQEQNKTIENQTEQLNNATDKITELEQQLEELQHLSELNKAKETTISIDPLENVKYGDNITISGLLVNEDSIALSNLNVTVKLNDEEKTVTTRNGEYKYDTTASVIGENTVTVTFAGTEKQTESTATYTFEVAKANTVIELSEIEAVKKGEVTTIAGILTTEKGDVLANKVVRLLVNNGRKTVKTNDMGEFSFDYTTTKVGQIDVTATFEGNNYYEATSNDTIFTVNKLSTIITIDPIETIIKGTQATITGTLTDENNNAIANAQVKITINGSPKTVKTDSEGRFTHTYTFGQIGENTIKVTYAGSANYDEAENQTTVEVTKAQPVITLDDIEEVTKGDTATFTGTLTDAEGNAIANAQVKITINGSQKTLKTDANGAFTHTFKMTKEGTNNITVAYSGSNDFEAAETTTTVEVVVKAE